MSEILVLKPKKEPSFINREMVLGAALGAFFMPAMPLIGGVIAAVGALGGALMGKNREEHEKQDGKAVSDSSFWSKETASGILLGLVGGSVINKALASAAVFSGVGAVPALVIALSVDVAALVVGTYAGNKIGKARQAGEYEEAKHQTIVNHLNNTVSPEVGKAMEYNLAHNKEWGKEVAEDRLLAAAQGRAP